MSLLLEQKRYALQARIAQQLRDMPIGWKESVASLEAQVAEVKKELEGLQAASAVPARVSYSGREGYFHLEPQQQCGSLLRR